MFDLIKKVLLPFGVSGSEEDIRSTIEKLIKPYVDELRTDALGNLVAIKRTKISDNYKAEGKEPEKIMYAAHMDTIGVIITFADEKGFLRFSNVGGVSPSISNGQRVIFENGLIGVVYYEEKIESMKDLKLSKMFIDIGARSKKEALEKVKIGDKAYFAAEPVLQGDSIISPHLDDRIGCAILIDAAEKISKAKDLYDKEIYYVFTVQEELGIRGAGPAAFGIIPDVAVAVDVTGTGDIPECKDMAVSIGNGPAIKIKDRSVICHPHVVERLKATCDVLKLPYQLEVLEYGGTDAGAIHVTAVGIITGAVSIPTRYIHTPNEMCSLRDVEQISYLLAGFAGVI